ncbi:MAG: SDR family NAD(P)-dependent oxidoreductase, partial [Pseudomonadota bacterium]
MDLQIKGKTAIMAGGSAGMGKATAQRLAEAGVELYISARREERLRAAAKELSEQYGTTVTPVVADSSTEEGRQALFAACPDPDILA